jgi:hypothetical protein
VLPGKLPSGFRFAQQHRGPQRKAKTKRGKRVKRKKRKERKAKREKAKKVGWFLDV